MFSLCNGFVKATNESLPEVESFTLAQYFKNADLEPEFRNVKANRSTRPSYSDNAVGYVQLKREGKFCHIIASITPEQAVHQKGYRVHCKVNEGGDYNKIEKAYCEDCAASQGGNCKHAIAFVTWLHRRSEEPSVTSTACYWKKSRLSKIGGAIQTMSTAQIMKEMEDSKRKSQASKNQPSKKPKQSKTAITPQARQSFVEEVASEVKDQTDTILFSAMLNRGSSYSMHHLIMDFKDTSLPQDGETFLTYCSSVMTDEECRNLAEFTSGQSGCYLWYDLRYGRNTGSKVHEASRCNTPDGSLTSSILGAHKNFDTDAMKRGRELEDTVFKTLETKIGKTGFVMRKQFPSFGASPDGILKRHIIEIKCPTSEHTVGVYLDKNSKPTDKFKGQMMLQMLMCRRSRGLFCVALPGFETKREMRTVEINFDKEYCRNLVDRSKNFWIKNIFPLLYRSC